MLNSLKKFNMIYIDTVVNLTLALIVFFIVCNFEKIVDIRSVAVDEVNSSNFTPIPNPFDDFIFKNYCKTRFCTSHNEQARIIEEAILMDKYEFNNTHLVMYLKSQNAGKMLWWYAVKEMNLHVTKGLVMDSCACWNGCKTHKYILFLDDAKMDPEPAQLRECHSVVMGDPWDENY